MIRPNRRLFAALTLVLCVAPSQWMPELGAQPLPPETLSEVARLLVGAGAVVTVPVKGKVRRSITKEARTFALPHGESSVMLLQLPDSSDPYDLTVVSFRRGVGLTTEVFVPSGAYFNAAFQQVGAFGEEQLEVRRFNPMRASGLLFFTGRNDEDSLVAEFAFGERDRAARYLLLYTRGDLVGQQASYGWLAPLVERSLEATIEVATAPLSIRQDVARSFEQLQALVKAGDHIRVNSGPGQAVEGRVVGLSSSLVLLVNDGQRVLQEDDVLFIERRGDPLWNGAAEGLLYGGAGAWGAAVFSTDANAERLGMVLGGAALGAGVGAAIDWALRGWTRVYRRPTRPAATVTFAPSLSGNHAGVRLTVGFP